MKKYDHPEDVQVFGSQHDVRFHTAVVFGFKWALNLFIAYLGLEVIQFMVPVTYRLFLPFFHFSELMHRTSDENIRILNGNLDEFLILAVASVVGVGTYYAYIFIAKSNKVATIYDGITSGAVKVKMASGLLGVTSVSITGSFIELKNNGTIDTEVNGTIVSEAFNPTVMYWKLAIHGALIVGFLALALVERLNHPPHRETDGGHGGTIHELTSPTGTEHTEHSGSEGAPDYPHDGHKAA